MRLSRESQSGTNKWRVLLFFDTFYLLTGNSAIYHWDGDKKITDVCWLSLCFFILASWKQIKQVMLQQRFWSISKLSGLIILLGRTLVAFDDCVGPLRLQLLTRIALRNYFVALSTWETISLPQAYLNVSCATYSVMLYNKKTVFMFWLYWHLTGATWWRWLTYCTLNPRLLPKWLSWWQDD